MDKQIIFKCDVDCIRKNTEKCFELDCIKGQESILKQLQAKEQKCSKYSKELARFQQEVVPKLRKRLRNKEQECDELRRVIRKDICSHYVLGECSQKHHNNCVGRNQCIKDLEQECERLKNKLNPKLKNAHCTYFEGQTGLCKAKEFTRCNPVGCKLYTIDELSTIVDLQQQLDQLKEQLEAYKMEAEEGKEINAELKAENDTYKKMFEDEYVQLVLTEIRSGERHLWFNKAEKYKQTLTEIKEIAEAESYLSPQSTRLLVHKILQKISEVENV